MATVEFTRNLLRFFPSLAPVEVDAATVAELVARLESMHPGLRAYLLDEAGRLRKHVNIYVDSEPVLDRQALGDTIGPQTRIYIAQALSGG